MSIDLLTIPTILIYISCCKSSIESSQYNHKSIKFIRCVNGFLLFKIMINKSIDSIFADILNRPKPFVAPYLESLCVFFMEFMQKAHRDVTTCVSYSNRRRYYEIKISFDILNRDYFRFDPLLFRIIGSIRIVSVCPLCLHGCNVIVMRLTLV